MAANGHHGDGADEHQHQEGRHQEGRHQEGRHQEGRHQEEPHPGEPHPGGRHGLGLAGRMANAFIHSPLSPLLLIACLAAGILGLLMTPRQEDPQISVPMVDVFFAYPGASAEQVASLAVDPLERMMSEIPGVKHVYSASQRGGGMVTVQFEVGELLELSLVKLYDKVMSNMDKIPPGVSQPMIKPKSVDDVPVVTLTLWSKDVDDSDLRLIALDVMQRLKEVKDTSQAFIVGGRGREIRIQVYPERLKGYGISAGQLAQTVQGANSEKETGFVEAAGGNFKVYSGSFLRTAEDVKSLVIGVRQGAPVYVHDVADVFEGAGEVRDVVQYFSGPAYESDNPEVPEGAPAVTVAIAKKVGTNGVDVADGILTHVEYLKGRIIPDNVNVAVTRNYGETANDKVNELILKLFVATGAVTLLVWFFLGFRASMVVLIVIPVVILITVFSAWILGFTIDRVSLFALIFSIGILVDDAIVVVENIYRRWLIKGDVDTETSVDAVAEVGNPTILATFTVIAALLPMGFVSGMMGPYMAPIPVLGSVAMLFSLFAAFMFTPWLAIRIRPSMARLAEAQRREHRQSKNLERFFRGLLNPLLDNAGLRILFKLGLWGVVIGCLAMFYTTDVTVKMLPFDNKSEFNVVVNMPDGTALPVTANAAQALAEELLKIEEVTAIQTYAGTASPFNFNGLVRHYYLRDDAWMADVQVQLLPKGERDRSSHQIAARAREILTPIAERLGAKIQVIEMPPGPPVLQTVVAEVYGPDDHTRRQAARDLTAIFAGAEHMVDVDNYLQDDYHVLRFTVDREKAVRRGVSVDTINQQLDMVMGGFKLGDVKVGSSLEPRYITLEVPMAVRSEVARMGELPIMTSGGEMIPLGELGRFERLVLDEPIFHKDLRSVEYVTGDVAGRLGAPIYGMRAIGERLESYTAPDGVKVEAHWIAPPEDTFKTAFEWTGEWTVTYETFRDMGIAFAAALVLIYMLVVWEFGNFRQPAVIMAPIPLTLLGIIPGHWLFGAEFTATSMIGFIALAGIIVRNSILLVDFAKKAVESGMELREAVIQSCRTRTRPIMITAFALVAGSSVIITDPIFQGMAISLMFGALVSTVLTLVVIPLGCVQARSAFLTVEQEEHLVAERVAAVSDVEDKPFESKALRRINFALRLIVFAVPILVYFLWMAAVTVFNAVKRLGWVRKVSGGLAMAFYLLRALPVFAWLFIRETAKSLFRAVRPYKPATAAAAGSMTPPPAPSSPPPTSSSPPPAPANPPPPASPPPPPYRPAAAGPAAVAEPSSTPEPAPVADSAPVVEVAVEPVPVVVPEPEPEGGGGAAIRKPAAAEVSAKDPVRRAPLGKKPARGAAAGRKMAPKAVSKTASKMAATKAPRTVRDGGGSGTASTKAKAGSGGAGRTKGQRRGIRLRGDGSVPSPDQADKE